MRLLVVRQNSFTWNCTYQGINSGHREVFVKLVYKSPNNSVLIDQKGRFQTVKSIGWYWDVVGSQWTVNEVGKSWSQTAISLIHNIMSDMENRLLISRGPFLFAVARKQWSNYRWGGSHDANTHQDTTPRKPTLWHLCSWTSTQQKSEINLTTSVLGRGRCWAN